MKVTFDSNILIYAAVADGSAKHLTARGLLDRALFSNAFLTLQSLGESFHVLTRRSHLPSAAARRFVDSAMRNFPIYAADQACFPMALDAHIAHGIPFWDAMIWATAERAGCDILVTEDLQDRRKLGRVTFLNPFELPFPPQLDAALAPLPET